LKQHTTDVDLKKFALSCMEETNSFEYTRGVLRGLYREMMQEIEALGGNPPLVKIIDSLAASGNLFAASG